MKNTLRLHFGKMFFLCLLGALCAALAFSVLQIGISAAGNDETVLYVHAETGSDEAAGSSPDMPLKTLTRAINLPAGASSS